MKNRKEAISYIAGLIVKIALLVQWVIAYISGFTPALRITMVITLILFTFLLVSDIIVTIGKWKKSRY